MGAEAEDPEGNPAKNTGGDQQINPPVEDPAGKLAHRQYVLEYVSDIALELSALLERERETALAADLRQIAERALKAKYNDPGS